jgi:soluble lytic murein transglycosylase-like protein
MWQHPDPEREKVRRVVAGAARNHGVDPHLALAVSWQESGWQMGVVSHARAIGAMQVLPSTGRWMEDYAGRPLDLRRLGDNARAGVLLLDVLSRHTQRRTHQIGAYYQGLGAVRRHGLYDETRAYVSNVEAIKHRLEAGRPPA